MPYSSFCFPQRGRWLIHGCQIKVFYSSNPCTLIIMILRNCWAPNNNYCYSCYSSIQQIFIEYYYVKCCARHLTWTISFNPYNTILDWLIYLHVYLVLCSDNNLLCIFIMHYPSAGDSTINKTKSRPLWIYDLEEGESSSSHQNVNALRTGFCLVCDPIGACT